MPEKWCTYIPDIPQACPDEMREECLLVAKASAILDRRLNRVEEIERIRLTVIRRAEVLPRIVQQNTPAIKLCRMINPYDCAQLGTPLEGDNDL